MKWVFNPRYKYISHINDISFFLSWIQDHRVKNKQKSNLIHKYEEENIFDVKAAFVIILFPQHPTFTLLFRNGALVIFAS